MTESSDHTPLTDDQIRAAIVGDEAPAEFRPIVLAD